MNFTDRWLLRGRSVEEIVIVTWEHRDRIAWPFQNGLDIVDIKTCSAFGQLRCKILQQLELAAGQRWTDETRTQHPINQSPARPVPTATPRIHSRCYMPEITLTYTPTDDLTLFGAYKKGSSPAHSVLAPPSHPVWTIRSATRRSYGEEVGLKSRLLDNQLALERRGLLL